MMPSPQPAALLHNATVQSYFIIFLHFLPPEEGFIVHAGSFTHAILEQGPRAVNTGGGARGLGD